MTSISKTPIVPPRQRRPLADVVPRLPEPPADLMAMVERARHGADGADGGGKPSEPPKSSKKPGLRLEIGSLADLGKFILLLAGLALGVWNRVDKAPERDVDVVEQKV